jgi:cytoskeleton protein RodZ
MNESHQAADKAVFRAKPDGTIDPAGEAGWFLQRERERQGLSLESAAAVLGIHESHLKGIESGDLTRLPSRQEALAMIACYGGHLGFEPQPLIQHYARVLPRPVPIQRIAGHRPPRPLSSAKIVPFSKALKLAMSTRGLSIVSSIGGLALLMGVFVAVLSPDEQQIVTGIDPLPTATLDSKPDDNSAVRIKELPMTEDVSAAETEKPEPTDAFEGGLDDLGPFIRQQIGEQAEESEVPAKAQTNHKTDEPKREPLSGRIVLKALGPVWFRVEDARGNVIVSQTMHKGESYAVPDREDLVIIARDGGMIGYEIDGTDHGRLGTPGEIVVGRPLTVSKLLNTRG